MIAFRILLIFCFLLGYNSNAQQNDIVLKEQDSVKIIDTAHSVRKATIFSAVVPGAGQIYNHIAMPPGKKKAYWKVPLIYAGLGSMTYFFFKNNTEVRDLKAEYIARDENQFLYEKYFQYDQQGVLTLFRQHQTGRDLAILGFGLIYGIQVLDAAIEAHFVGFDVGEDLTLNIRPKIYDSYSVGLSLQLDFNRHSKH